MFLLSKGRAMLQLVNLSVLHRVPRAQKTCLRLAHVSVDYQFLQRSKLPTMHFQKSLPRLPIPLLSKTCDRYLAALHPILESYQYLEAQQTVNIFHTDVGMELQALLKRSDDSNKNTSYISKAWFDMYLSDRKPLPLNYNPLLVMKPDPRPEYQTQLLRATNLIISSLRFWRSLQEGLLEPEVFHMNPAKSNTEQFRLWTRIAPSVIATYVAYAFKAFPLDMSQYKHLFGVSRVPQVHKDRLVSNSSSKHILVLSGGNLYAIDVLDEHRNLVSPQVILGRLQEVMRLDAARDPSAYPIGVLTAGQRDVWARTREHLLNGISPMNAHLLENEVDAALFCVCLDSRDDPVYDENNPLPLFRHMLAGSGRNRWFDKSVSLLVSADGTAAVNFEHSWGDGVAVLRYFNEIYKDTIEHPFVHPDTKPIRSCETSVRPINFEVDDKLGADIKQAIATNAAIDENLEMHMLRYPSINKNHCKGSNVSPDSIMQLSFQLAYRRAFGNYVSTYESCSTAAFRNGRTETMRPCTMRTKQFCEAVLKAKHNLHEAELRIMLDQCSKLHVQLTKEAAMGQGFDRHLFALKDMALTNKMPLPDIFMSEAYQKLNRNIISTSTLTSDALLAGAFGPVVPDGLGIGYSINNDECGVLFTSYKNGCNGKMFLDGLKQAFCDIRNVLKRKL